MTANDGNQQSQALQFEEWWSAPGVWVEEPNHRRQGWSGMMRLELAGQAYYVKKQCNHLCRTLGHPVGWPTVSREYESILRLQALGLRTPEPVFHGSRRSDDGIEAILVTEELTGFSALSDQSGLPAALRAQLAEEVGRFLGKMHRAHLQHSCLYDKHIMVRWQGATPQIALIDLEKLRRPLLPWRAAQHDLAQLKRHQFIWPENEWALLETAHRRASA